MSSRYELLPTLLEDRLYRGFSCVLFRAMPKPRYMVRNSFCKDIQSHLRWYVRDEAKGFFLGVAQSACLVLVFWSLAGPRLPFLLHLCESLLQPPR